MILSQSKRTGQNIWKEGKEKQNIKEEGQRKEGEKFWIIS